MSKEEQLKKLLEMLDLTSAMKSCPSRSKRLKLLKKTISDVRMEMSSKKEPPSLEQNNPKEEEKAPLFVPQATEEEGALLLNHVIFFTSHNLTNIYTVRSKCFFYNTLSLFFLTLYYMLYVYMFNLCI